MHELSKTPSIIVENKFSRIENDNDFEFLSRLNSFLSFKYAGAEFTPAFKSHRWDGREYLLSKKLSFMTGLLDLVLGFYKRNDKEVEVIDKRLKLTPNNEIDILQQLLKQNIIPYDYQIAAIEKAVQNDRMIFKHATGSGKSITAALIAAKFNKPTVVYVVSKELLYQFHANFTEYFNQKIGIIGAGHCDIQNITIVSVWTLGKMLGLKKQEILLDNEQNEDDEFTEQNRINALEYIQKCDVHLFDECHISAAKTIQNIYKTINPLKIFGFSGTPVRDDGADLLINGIFGNIVDEVSASELIKRGILAKPYIKFVYSKGNAHFTDTYPKVYAENITANNFRNALIVREVKNLLAKNYQVLVLYRNIKHGNIIYDLCVKNDINCDILNGKDTDEKRKEVKDNLLNKNLNCVISSMIYDIGIDIPTLDGLVLAGSGKSSVKTLQRIGRVIRNGKEKKQAAVIDFMDDVKFLKKHSKIRRQIYETEPEFVVITPKYNEK
jgi:superfamily II DNA or RNA helicase